MKIAGNGEAYEGYSPDYPNDPGEVPNGEDPSRSDGIGEGDGPADSTMENNQPNADIPNENDSADARRCFPNQADSGIEMIRLEGIKDKTQMIHFLIVEKADNVSAANPANPSQSVSSGVGVVNSIEVQFDEDGQALLNQFSIGNDIQVLEMASDKGFGALRLLYLKSNAQKTIELKCQ